MPEGQTLAQFALRWILSSNAWTCAIPGGKRPAQIAENMAAADLGPLDAATLAKVAGIYETFAKPLVHHRW